MPCFAIRAHFTIGNYLANMKYSKGPFDFDFQVIFPSLARFLLSKRKLQLLVKFCPYSLFTQVVRV